MPIDISRVIAIAETHLVRFQGPEEIAIELDYNYETLRKEFRKRMGVPLGRYLSMRRVACSKNLLIKTDLYNYQICEAVGFSSEVTGARTFKRLTGMTMQEYRERSRAGASANDK